MAAHPHKLLLPEPCGLSWADITLATAINKCLEMEYTQLAGPSVNTAHAAEPSGGTGAGVQGQQGKGPAHLDGTKAGAAGATVTSFMPLTQKLLQDNPMLVEWADATVRRYWPEGVSTLYKPVGKT